MMLQKLMNNTKRKERGHESNVRIEDKISCTDNTDVKTFEILKHSVITAFNLKSTVHK